MKPNLNLAIVGACAAAALALAWKGKEPDPARPEPLPPLPFPPSPSQAPPAIPNVGEQPFEAGSSYSFDLAYPNGTVPIVEDALRFDGFTIKNLHAKDDGGFVFSVEAIWRGDTSTSRLANDLGSLKFAFVTVPRKIG